MKKHILYILISFLSFSAFAQNNQSFWLPQLNDGIHHWNLEHPVRNYHRLDTSEIIEIANNLLAWQNPDGGWPKNIDWLGVLNVDSVREALRPHYRESTLDNRNTWPQIEYLSEAYIRTKNPKYKKSVEDGIHYLLQNQNASGGWRGWDVDAITYNDEVMTGVMNLFLEIKYKKKRFKWLDQKLFKLVCNSLDRAILVTLQTQIEVNGKKTAWCQQHDHETLEPTQARTFELPAITANESCDVLLFLMRIKDPSPQVIDAVEAGINWLRKSQINDLRIEKVNIPTSKIINQEYPYDLIVVKDPTADPIWARFYEIETNKPFMCTRKGEKVYNLDEVDPERRTGYAWYGTWPETIFPIYNKWKKIYLKN